MFSCRICEQDTAETSEKVQGCAKDVVAALVRAGVRAKFDERDNYSAGGFGSKMVVYRRNDLALNPMPLSPRQGGSTPTGSRKASPCVLRLGPETSQQAPLQLCDGTMAKRSR